MNKQGTSNFLKAIGTTALSLALVSAAFVGANTLAFASGTQPELVAADALAAAAPPVALQQEYKEPTLNVIWDKNLDENGNPYPDNIPSLDALSYEEAAKICAEYNLAYVWGRYGR